MTKVPHPLKGTVSWSGKSLFPIGFIYFLKIPSSSFAAEKTPTKAPANWIVSMGQ